MTTTQQNQETKTEIGKESNEESNGAKSVEKIASGGSRQRPENLTRRLYWIYQIAGPIVLVGGLVALAVFVSWSLAFVILCILGLVTIHEYGHFWAARRTGMQVTEFALGFGPKLWSMKRGEVTYAFRAIPAGAFVRIPGMYMNEKKTEDIDDARSFRKKSFGARVLVAVAGPATHFIVVILLFFILFTFIGFSGVNADIRETNNWSVTRVVENSPADEAGIEIGDRITAIKFSGEDKARPVKTYKDLVENHIVPNPGAKVSIIVLRGDEQKTLKSVELLPRRRQTDSGKIEGYGFLGIAPKIDEKSSVNPALGLAYAFRDTGVTIKEVIVGTGRAFSLSSISDFVGDTFSFESTSSSQAQSNQEIRVVIPAPGEPIPIDAPPPEEGPNESRITSIVGIVQIGDGSVGQSARQALLFFIFVNIALGLVNLLPILPFDGGHVSIAIYEKIRSKNGARYHADISKMIYATAPILLFLIFIVTVAVIRDISDPFNLN